MMIEIQQTIQNSITHKTISMDDVAALSYKIGCEIWGEENFAKKMDISNNTMLSTVPIINNPEVA